ncbi:hypothetical protein NRK67_00750 [Fusobacteria bacterium ZRK30]|nr:hypothetical protein NRK67_00750 [Fusobacteria bacterium ZRK30]
MIKRELNINKEFYDISKYIGIVNPNEDIYESYSLKEKLIVLTLKRLMIIEKDIVDIELNFSSITGYDFFCSNLKPNNLCVKLKTDEKIITLNFKEKKKYFRFISNLMVGLKNQGHLN